MTHDELLAEIIGEGDGEIVKSTRRWHNTKALRAVVELHPMIERGEPFIDGDRYGVTIYMCGKCNVPYPCEDIQAIEKELK